MIVASLALALALQPPTSAAAIPPASEVTYRREIYRDAEVIAYLLEIPPGHATQMHRHDKDILSIFINGGRTTATFEGRAPFTDTIPAGAIRYRAKGFAHATRNEGAEVFRSVILEFTRPQGEPETPPRPGARFCTAGFCAEDLTLAPGEAPPAAGHSLWIGVTEAALGSRDAVRIIRPGDVADASPPHEMTQRGPAPARGIRITFR